MILDLIIGVLAGMLLASLVANGLIVWLHRDRDAIWRMRVREEQDARRAAELRSGEQIDAMLDRIATSDHLELSAPPAPAPTGERAYVSDEPYDDDAWNDLRTEKETD